jgi:hypothetical protein
VKKHVERVAEEVMKTTPIEGRVWSYTHRVGQGCYVRALRDAAIHLEFRNQPILAEEVRKLEEYDHIELEPHPKRTRQ